jgi:hypothetical protein
LDVVQDWLNFVTIGDSKYVCALSCGNFYLYGRHGMTFGFEDIARVLSGKAMLAKLFFARKI